MNWADHSHTRTPIRRWSHWFAAIVWLLFASGFSWTRSNSSAPAFVSIVNAYHSLPALTANEPNTLCNDIHCLHGTCRKGECICERGWKGKLCHICGGRVRLDQTSGFISDGKKNYTADQQCTWLIDARHHGNASLIRLKFIEFETECNWDHLYVFKGDSMFAPLVAAFSGVLARRSSPQSDFKLPDIEIEGGLAYLYFYSDTAYFMSGFNLSYQVNRCSSTGKCFDRENDASAIFANEDALDSEYDSNACSADTWHTNHSNCNCNDGLNSLRCFHQFCPNKCSLHGHCDSQSRTCVCNDGFAGADCGQIKLEGYWEAFNWMKRQPILGRALHQAAVDRNQMYVAGGEFFETAAASKQFLMRFDFDAQSWHNVSNSFHQQMHRFGHTLIAYDHHLYMFGGLNPDGVILNELWNFSTVNQQWTLMPTKPDVASNCLVKLCAPLAVAGHTATLVGNRMYVIFGYNPRFGYLNTVQEFRFDILKWSIVSVTGALVKGGFGHSSAYHPDSQTIYVYGGHHSAGSDSVLVDHLYGFNLPDSKWLVFNTLKYFCTKHHSIFTHLLFFLNLGFF